MTRPWGVHVLMGRRPLPGTWPDARLLPRVMLLSCTWIGQCINFAVITCVKSQLATDIIGVSLGSAAVLVFNPSWQQYVHNASWVPCVHALCYKYAFLCCNPCALWGPGVQISSRVFRLGCALYCNLDQFKSSARLVGVPGGWLTSCRHQPILSYAHGIALCPCDSLAL